MGLRLVGGRLEARAPGLDSLCFYRGGGRPVYCFIASPAVARSRSYAPFDYALYTRGSTIAWVSAGRVARALGGGVFEAVLWAGPRGGEPVARCRVSVSGGRVSVGPCEPPGPRGPPGCWAPDPLARPLVCSVDERVLSTLARLAPRGRWPQGLVWGLLEWMESSLSYDYSRAAGSGDASALPPQETLARRRGVCRDFAVLAAAALVAGGLRESFMGLLVLPGGAGHAVAAARLGRGFFVLDQKLPPMEWGDYVEYALAGVEPEYAALYRVTRRPGGLAVEAFHDVRLSSWDSYPSDEPPPSLGVEVAREAARLLGAELDPGLAGVPRLLGVGVFVQLTAPRLEEAPGGRGDRPLTSLYHPAFHRQWVSMLAGRAAAALGRRGRPGRVWVGLERRGGRDVIMAYSVPPGAARARLEPHPRGGGAGRLVVECPARDCDSVAVLVYPEGGGSPLAGLAPPGYAYQGIETITVAWRRAPGRVAVDLPPRLPRGVLAVIHRGTPVYAARVGAGQ